MKCKNTRSNRKTLSVAPRSRSESCPRLW